MSLLPSVQPFHAIAYPIDPLLALDIRYGLAMLLLLLIGKQRVGTTSHLNFIFLLCSRKYAAQCSIIASRFGLPAFNHPAPIPIKRNGGFERLRVGYVLILSISLSLHMISLGLYYYSTGMVYLSRSADM